MNGKNKKRLHSEIVCTESKISLSILRKSKKIRGGFGISTMDIAIIKDGFAKIMNVHCYMTVSKKNNSFSSCNSYLRNYFRTLLHMLKNFKYFVVLQVINTSFLIVQYPGISQS